ncbi:MAG: FecR domain-containing protein [Dokdonella sp.]|uniref:FecR family protein n=1 Tax=Dokdonella sp. TaxID=2291710 RepID=UPI001B497096|nr:FecR domain-containing protein [Dokdonella sp.]MCC6440679.1 FecR domain-containing protein [Rhodanobacteraceae bacterium]MBK8122501.1 FecR domain-containing protein [Dokdonella sp.]MBP6327541.1 FecR domain-containing protein [Dokdonella sp.]MBP6329168.1 FecR domain-containing protein [Dokdonella sp.]HNV08040.1 FecR domain-containing protein [Dokdonella sp.]
MRDSRWIEQHAAEWLARRECNAWTQRDGEQLEAWLSSSTRHRVAFLRLEAAWKEADRLHALSNPATRGGVPARYAWTAYGMDGSSELDANRQADGRTARRVRRRAQQARGWRMALVASLAVVAIALIAWSGWNRSGRQEASFASRTGELKTIALADGSSATLSSASQIDVVMTRDARSVTLLRGEAYFEVAHDAARPFSVSANDHQVVAVGTRFSVRRDARNLRVVVTEGKVRLDSPADAHGHDGPSTFLPAGSIASAGPNGVLVRSLSLGEAERHLEWRSGFLAFDDTALVDAVAEFNRFSLRKIELGDSGVALLRIGGNFRWDNSDGFVSLLEHGFPVRVERKPDRIVLHSP